MEYRYKLGQAVRLKKDLDLYGYQKYYMKSGPRGLDNTDILVRRFTYAYPEMKSLLGEVVHIKGYYNEAYTIRELGLTIVDDMLDPIEENECVCESLL